MINYGKQFIDDEDIDEIIKVLKSDYLTQGPTVKRFEEAISKKVKVKYAVASNSGTSSLHLACLALGLTKGDILWTVPNTFVASANCGRFCGADVDFVDIDPGTWNMSVTELEKKLAKAKKNNCLPKIIVPVHFSGQPTEQEKIWELSKKYNFKIIEDATHSLGAKRKGEPVGSCKWSDITVLSFHPVKMITTAEGGMTLTNDLDLCKKMKLLRTHGITRQPSELAINKAAPYYYEQHILGYNYRMNDIQACLGITQLKKIDKFVSKRNKLASRYQKHLIDLPIELPKIFPENHSSYHIFVIRIKDSFLANKSRDKIYKELIDEGIAPNLHYLPVHLHPYYLDLGFKKGQFIEAEKYSNSAITIPLYFSMTEEEQDKVIAALKSILQ